MLAFFLQPNFLWYGIDAFGVECNGVRECESSSQLHAQLMLEGIEVVKIRRLFQWQRVYPKKLAAADVQSLLGQWVQLLGSGLPLLSCIRLVQLENVSNRLRYELIKLQDSLLAGESFSKALAHSGLFEPILVKLVAAGEASGELSELLSQVHAQKSRQIELKRKLLRSLFMPILTLMSGFCVCLVIIYLVVPKVANLYATSSHKLPALTSWLLELSSVGSNELLLLLTLVLTTYGIALWLWSKKTARLKLEWIFWRIPGLGRLVFLHAHADLFLVLSLTLNAGVPLITCLELAKKSSRSLRIKRDIEDIVLKLNQGQKISLIIGVLGWPPQVLQLIRVGEASGKLGVSFTQLHHYFEVQVSNQSVWLEQLIEPLLLLLVATFVGLILIALYLPLFEMGQMM